LPKANCGDRTALEGGIAVLKTLTVGPLEVNCYLLWDDATKDAFVIDPGGDSEKIKSLIAKERLKVRYIVVTHGHFDHVGGVVVLKSSLGGAKIAIHKDDVGMMSESHEHGVIFGVKTPVQPSPEVLLTDGQELKAGGLTLKVIHTPGHTHGGVCLLEENAGLLFTGDTLFAGSIGRTDLNGGSHKVIMDSIKKKILPLADTIKVLPGHGPDSTIGRERKTNPFISGEAV